MKYSFYFLVFIFFSCARDKKDEGGNKTFTVLEYKTNRPVNNAEIETHYCSNGGGGTWGDYSSCPAQEIFYTDSLGKVVLNPWQQHYFTVTKDDYFKVRPSFFSSIPDVVHIDKKGVLHLNFTTNKNLPFTVKANVSISPENQQLKYTRSLPPEEYYEPIGQFFPASSVSIDLNAFAYQKNKLRISFYPYSTDSIVTSFDMTGLDYTLSVNY